MSERMEGYLPWVNESARRCTMREHECLRKTSTRTHWSDREPGLAVVSIAMFWIRRGHRLVIGVEDWERDLTGYTA